jgi:hypothetical protein
MRPLPHPVRAALLVGALALTIAACSDQGDDDRSTGGPTSGQPVTTSRPSTTTSPDSGRPSWFFAQNAPRGAFTPPTADGTGTLTLDRPGALTVAITERPARAVTHLPTAEFVAGWDQEFGDDPPNAVVAVLGSDGQQHEAELELLRPAYTTTTARLTYPVRVLDGSLPTEFTDVSLMIDDAGLDVQLNIVNESEDQDDQTWVLFRVNQASQGGSAVAWEVVENLGEGDNHPIEVGMQYTVTVTDSMGNTSPQLVASNGQQFTASAGPAGDQLTPSPSGRPGQVEVVNGLPESAVTATLFDGGRSIATVLGIAPAQTAVFRIEPTIWIAAVPAGQAEPGQTLDPALVAAATPLDLLGVASADLVITGGGTTFTLQDIVTA